MNAKQRRKQHRELMRKRGCSYYVVFRIDGEAIAIVQHITNRNLTFVDSYNRPLLMAWAPHSDWRKGPFSAKRISEPEATTLTEFGVPLHRKPSGIIKLDIG